MTHRFYVMYVKLVIGGEAEARHSEAWRRLTGGRDGLLTRCWRPLPAWLISVHGAPVAAGPAGRTTC